MTERDIVLGQISHRDTPRVPYTFGFEQEMRDRLDKYFGRKDWEADYNLRHYMAPVGYADTVQQRWESSLRSVDVFHCVWEYTHKPWRITNLCFPEPEMGSYKFPSEDEFVSVVTNNLAQFKENCERNPDKFRVIDMGWGIFERSWLLRGFENVLMDSLAEPEFYAELCNRIADLYVAMARACRDIPADAFLFGDDWGDQRGIILGPDTWRKFIKPCWKRVYAEVRSQGKIVMSHCCGSMYDVIPDAIEIGLQVYESAQPEPAHMSPYDLKREFGDRLTFWGCLGTQYTLPLASPDELRAEIRKLAAEMPRGGGFILEPAKPLQGDTPIANALAAMEEFARL